MSEGKVCSKCKEYKLLNEYYKAKDKPMGVKSACKQCFKPIKHLYYINNKEKYRTAYLMFLERNPNYRSLYQGKKII